MEELPDFKTHYKATVIKTLQYRYKVTNKGPCNRTEGTEETHVSNVCSINAPSNFNGERKIFLANGTGTSGYLYGKK